MYLIIKYDLLGISLYLIVIQHLVGDISIATANTKQIKKELFARKYFFMRFFQFRLCEIVYVIIKHDNVNYLVFEGLWWNIIIIHSIHH